MIMSKFEKGMLAKSLAGHDEGNVYIIVETDERYVYLVDGKIRTLSKPKRKRKKHVQLILKKYNVSEADDTAIKKILKDWKREEEK
jgi:ribosomal protein L14E/L6E/L27E